jgi:hypothetical protein
VNKLQQNAAIGYIAAGILFMSVIGGYLLLFAAEQPASVIEPRPLGPMTYAPDCGTGSDAFAWSLQFVRRALAPRPANINRTVYAAGLLDPDRCEWSVSGQVDTTNIFGAPVRQYWTMSMAFDGQTWSGSGPVWR